MMLVFLPAGIIETLDNMVLLQTNMIGVTWSLQVELVGSLAIALMWLLGRHSPAKMLAALAVAIAVVPLARGTVLVFMPAFAFGGLIGAVPPRVWSSRVLLWAGLTLLLTANLFFGHGGVARCFRDRWRHGGGRPHRRATVRVPAIGGRPVPRRHQLSALSHSSVQHAGVRRVLAPFPPLEGLPPFAVDALVSVSITVPLAWLLHIVIEAPCMRRQPRLALAPRASGGRAGETLVGAQGLEPWTR